MKYFNTNGCCDPERHYMIDLSERLHEVKQMIDDGQYFSITRARQYGKTTLIHGLVDFLRNDYEVLSLDFQTLSFEDFKNEHSFTAAFSRELLEASGHIPESVKGDLEKFSAGTAPAFTLSLLFKTLIQWCELSDRKIVLIIDEVDSATNNQVFLDFLSQLRAYYLKRGRAAAFQSVILAGVYDVKNIRRKIRPEEEHRTNSPWNIAADFLVDMSFSVSEIAGMLQEYEADHHTGMDILLLSRLLYASTSGYPYLVSRLCKLIDERISGTKEFPDKADAWTRAGYLEAEKRLLTERNTLFESLVNKLTDYPQLRTVLYELLFTGKAIPYNPLNQYIDTAEMFGFVKNSNGNAVVANRIFESVLYNLFLSQEYMQSREYDAIRFTVTRDMHLYFETNRLAVRKYISDDIHALYRIMCDVRVHTYTKDKDNPWDERRTEEYIQFIINKDFKTLDCFHGAIIEKCSNQLIGLCGLNPYKKEEPEIEIKIGVPYWNKGYATELGRQMIKESFAATDIRGIYGMALPENIASKRVLEKIGMQHLGNQIFRDHEYSFYYIARSHWENFAEN